MFHRVLSRLPMSRFLVYASDSSFEYLMLRFVTERGARTIGHWSCFS